MNNYDVMFIGHLQGFGGAEKSMVKVANAMSRCGLRIAIITFDENNAPFEIDGSVDVHFIKIESPKTLGRIIERYKKSNLLLAENKTKLAISFWFQLAIIFQLLSSKYKFKNYYSERGDPGDSEYSGIYGKLRNYFFSKMNGFIFQTKGAQMYFKEEIQQKSIVIPNPVYIKYDDYPISNNRNRSIVGVGRLHPQKHFDLLINAFALVAPKFPDVKLIIYGSGTLKKSLMDLIEHLDISERVILREPTKQIFEAIKDSSVFVLSSLFEGMPNVLMEAMALGIPCLSTDCSPGGAAELIKDGYNGYLLKTFEPEEMAEKLEYMLSHPNEMETLGKNAKDICYTHSEDVIMRKWYDYINKEL